jgi:hypothetical protein
MKGRDFEFAYGRLGVAVLAAHGQVQAEPRALDDVHVASLASAHRVDPPVEWLVRVDLDDDPRVLAVHRNCENKL